ncbi:Beta,beta-carotene 9',10'-oxygenase [Holothuria leucospilota]|uniref:Beta,beta-carotene 9',10'-oxygenase n=1 Tax=Holothuria leucospilota TaxID=206669 RepID=A0A9Q1BDK4_HOLLE|nr:Beta,beta-carotene 9',10'-oxygenase [Holothuria leucospilota]
MPKIMKNNASLHSKEEKPISVANLYKSSEETPTRVESNVIGPIPDWISGNLFRNGPGKFEAGDDKVGHLFDGFALMHKFEIAKGKVFYSSRYLRGEGYTKAMAQNRIVISGFGTSAVPDPCKSIFSRFFSYFQPPPASDNCNVNYMQIGEDFYALTESPRFVKVDPEVLQTEHQHDIRKYVAVHIATAHPHYGNDQTVYNMGSSYGGQSFYNIIKIPPPNPAYSGSTTDPLEKASVLCKIPASSPLHPSYFHSFAITPNYIVFVEQPLTINIFKILFARILGQNFAGCINYTPSSLAKFHVIRLKDGAILPQKFTADAFFCFHHINAFEDDGHLVVDLCAYDDTQVIFGTYMDVLKRGNLPVTNALAKRFVLPMVDGTDELSKENLVSLDYCEASSYLLEDGSIHCTPETLCQGQKVELPRINYEQYNGQKYRYFYSLSGDGPKIVKVDTVKKSFKLWEDPSCYPSEPVFVPRPGAEEEDDGVVLSSVIDLKGTGRPPFLVVLDAKTFTELARAETPADVPFGIHGIFIPK